MELSRYCVCKINQNVFGRAVPLPVGAEQGALEGVGIAHGDLGLDLAVLVVEAAHDVEKVPRVGVHADFALEAGDDRAHFLDEGALTVGRGTRVAAPLGVGAVEQRVDAHFPVDEAHVQSPGLPRAQLGKELSELLLDAVHHFGVVGGHWRVEKFVSARWMGQNVDWEYS